MISARTSAEADSQHADDGAYLKVGRVAQIMDVSRKRVYQMLAEGKLQALRFGPRQTRITRASLAAYLQVKAVEHEENQPVRTQIPEPSLLRVASGGVGVSRPEAGGSRRPLIQPRRQKM